MYRRQGESFSEYQACRAYVYDVARRIDLTKAGNRLDSDGVKLVSSTWAKNIADRAIQVLGGYGYVGEYVVERLWRDSKPLAYTHVRTEDNKKNII